MQIEPLPAYSVKTETAEYLRLGWDNWYEIYGNSFEALFDSSTLERDFQIALRKLADVTGNYDLYLD